MTATIDRLNEARTDAADRCMLLGAVASTLDTLHDELLEQRDRHDAIIDAVMDALARVRPGWERTKRNWEAPRITTYVDASDAERRLDEARAEVERLRAEVASLRQERDAGDGWDPGPLWARRVEAIAGRMYAIWSRDGYTVSHETPDARICVCYTPNGIGPAVDKLREAIEWCEEQMDSASAVEADGPGADPPERIAEGDGDTGALQESAVPAAPVSGAEQSCGETGVDRPRVEDERIVGPREGEVVANRANPPYGYEIDDSGDELVLLTVQREAAVMLRICELLDERRNATEIAATLNDEGHTSRTGTAWTPSSVRARILGSVDEWRGVV